MNGIDLVDLLIRINRKTPPNADSVAELGVRIANNPAFFHASNAPVTRFDVDEKGKPYEGYGFRNQLKLDPRYELYFCVADLAREGLRPEYLNKLWKVWCAHPEFFGKEGLGHG